MNNSIIILEDLWLGLSADLYARSAGMKALNGWGNARLVWPGIPLSKKNKKNERKYADKTEHQS
jgi:hypothetical protein